MHNKMKDILINQGIPRDLEALCQNLVTKAIATFVVVVVILQIPGDLFHLFTGMYSFYKFVVICLDFNTSRGKLVREKGPSSARHGKVE